MSLIQLALGLVWFDSSHTCVKQGIVIMLSVNMCLHTMNSGYIICKETGELT